jgi:hypothetical protein
VNIAVGYMWKEKTLPGSRSTVGKPELAGEYQSPVSVQLALLAGDSSKQRLLVGRVLHLEFHNLLVVEEPE